MLHVRHALLVQRASPGRCCLSSLLVAPLLCSDEGLTLEMSTLLSSHHLNLIFFNSFGTNSVFVFYHPTYEVSQFLYKLNVSFVCFQTDRTKVKRMGGVFKEVERSQRTVVNKA